MNTTCRPAAPDASAPWWEDGYTISPAHAEPGFLAKGINAFWQRLKGWLLLPLAQQDPLTCSESLLSLLAWERTSPDSTASRCRSFASGSSSPCERPGRRRGGRL
ncbi:hypothetical protein PI861_00005 [Aeromonas salmonicida subsp. salmonicida]|uniref:hypothetical protein n=1 Tax=Aeromonas salmonicida TaxID=645 RepID=UPI00192F8255|nr:hypothetical protein [Aeromonas salmonicida]WCB54609.1 hypothetical protein PI861_00005 [Aeromonas salmonicida subsp. salmonicida]